MEKKSSLICRALAATAFVAATLCAHAAEAVYRIVEYNKSTGEFALAASGMVPKGSWAYFQNDYGATTGNRYNQIPRNRKATLWLEGWKGCKLRSVTLSMCSNSKSGQVGLAVCDGEKSLYVLRPADFASETWFGQWVSKDLNVYVDITKRLDIPALAADEASLVLQGGTAEGSVYVSTITIEYDEAPGAELESPLGWAYEKLTKKSALSEGDEVMIYRNGCAAADFDGMQTSHYLDAMVIASTADVSSPDVLRFTLGKADGQESWTLTDQNGRALGATGKQSLAWDEGSTLWTVSLGYDGAEVTNANADCGTLRYNAPAGSYARFNVYTSTSLPLPFLYRKGSQRQPEVSRSLTFSEPVVTADVSAGHVVLKPSLLPATATDRRIRWTCDNGQVAMVNGGLVTLLNAGEATIAARAADGGCEASVRLVVTAAAGVASPTASARRSEARKLLVGSNVFFTMKPGRHTFGGRPVPAH